MSCRKYAEIIKEQALAQRFLCVGLDPVLSKIPARFHGQYAGQTIYNFLREIILATADHVCAFKLNIAYFENEGAQGLTTMALVIGLIREKFPRIAIILDYKRGDTYESNLGYAEEAFMHFKVDAVTVAPYMGLEALRPFFAKSANGIYVVCHSSNPGAREFQERMVVLESDEKKAIETETGFFAGQAPKELPLYQFIAWQASRNWNVNNNLGLVMGATYPEQIGAVRGIVGDEVPLLLPGAGEQKANLARAVLAARNRQNSGFIVPCSRCVIYAPDPHEQAGRLNQEIREALSLNGRKND